MWVAEMIFGLEVCRFISYTICTGTWVLHNANSSKFRVFLTDLVNWHTSNQFAQDESPGCKIKYTKKM